MKRIFLAALAVSSAACWAQSDLKVDDAWVRGTVAHQKATGAFMRLTAGRDAKLVGASSPVAGLTEVHEMALDNGVMKMRAVTGLALPAGKTVELKPGGYHVMLMDLKAPIRAGEPVPLTLVLESQGGQREQVELQLPVRALGAAAMGQAQPAGHGQHMGH